MYKRPKRSHTGSFIMSRAACSSASVNRDNIVDEFSKPTSSNSDHSQIANKETTPNREQTISKTLTSVPAIFKETFGSRSLADIFSLCGMDIENESSHVLKVDQAVFVHSLTSKLFTRRTNSSENVAKFLDKFKEHFSSRCNFLKALSPTTTSSNCDIARGSTQDSLVKLLLQVEELQTDLSNYVLDRLAELGLQNDEFDSEMAPITWVKLSLQPFRFLNSTVSSKNLCERLFDIIFSSSDRVIQQEIIICLPDIIADSEHHFAVTELSKLLQCELELMPSILDALANLNIHKDIKRSVRESLITTMRTSPIEHLPNIVKFLLGTCESDSVDEVISGLRRELFAENSVSMKNTISEEDVDPEYIHILLFSNIRNCLLANKQLTDAWIKNISHSSTSIKNRPLDIIITIILYDICAEASKKRSLETLIRNRIKSSFFTITSIEETFTHFRSVIIEYFPSLMSVLSKLLKSTDICITEFITAFYLFSFDKTESQQSKIVIKELLAFIGAGDANDAQTALNILSELAKKHPDKMKSVASLLRVLLNKLNDLSLNDVLQLMDILCHIAFTEEECESGIAILKENITKLIEKRINSSNIKFLRIGIIAAVMAIKHITSHCGDESNVWPDKSSDDFEENFLTEKGKRALHLLRMIIENTKVVPEAQGFAFDQLSLLLMNCRSLDKSLLFYTSMIMKENMKKYFLICSDEIKSIELLECTLKFGLNEDEEFVVLNLTPTLIEEMNSNVNSGLRMYAIVLPSLLRLIRGLEYEDLREIDGLLECPIMVPAPKVFEEFDLQSPEVQTVIMDSLFHLTNWFRELVNCFARMIKQPNGKKVLVRLRTLIWLQNMIAKYLPLMLARDYCPPKCHFHKDVKPPNVGNDRSKKKTGDKKQKKDPKTNDIRKHLVSREGTQQQNVTVNELEEEVKDNDNKTANLKNYKDFFRELDLDIWIMLSLPLTINPEPEKDWELAPEFGPSELLFIMEDLVEKLHFVLVVSSKKNPFKNSSSVDIGLTSGSLYVGAPEIIVKNMIKLIPRLCAHLQILSKYCNTMLVSNDHIFDSTGMFLPESKEIKICYALILKAFYILFNWSGFEASNNSELLAAALFKMTSRIECSSKSQSEQIMIRECAAYLTEFQETVLHLDCAVNLVSLVEALAKYSEHKEVNKILGKVCWNFLSRHWYNWDGCEEKGAVFNKNIEYLITTFFHCSNDKLKAVSSMCDWLKTEIMTLNNRDSSLSTLPNINKGNCYILIRILLKVLGIATKEAIENRNDPNEKLTIWLTLMKSMESIVSVLKQQPARINLISFVKGSANILRLFLTQGITVCSQMFRVESAVVSQILKTLQITSRYLQKIFDNTRVTEDSALCAYMPNIRSLLESILLKVKNIMVINGCTEAFFVGSMRNKNLQGEDILSQTTAASDSERMDIDEEVTAASNINDVEFEDDASKISSIENSNNGNSEDKGEESDIIISDVDESDKEN